MIAGLKGRPAAVDGLRVEWVDAGSGRTGPEALWRAFGLA